MKRLVLAMSLLLSNGLAYGDWVQVDRIVMANSIVYVDSSTIHLEGNLVKMWALFDYQTEQHMEGLPVGSLVLSSKNHYEYDCAEKRQRLIEKMWLSDHMGSGKIVHRTAGDQSWYPALPEGPEHWLWMAACPKPLTALRSPNDP